MYDRLAEIAAEYLKKGSQVYVEGKLRTRKWQDKEGRDRYTTEINANEMQMLGSRAGGGGGGGGGGMGRGESRGEGRPAPAGGGSARREQRCRRVRRRHPVLRRLPPGESMPRVYIKTFGCQMNEYDSARMADVLACSRRARARPTTRNEADVLLLNTCSMREKAQDKVFSLLGRWRELKAARPHVIIGVGGCVASQEGAAITDARAVRRPGVRPADHAPPAGDARAVAQPRAAPWST